MANRYWVGGTGSWSGGAGLNWSTTSGGIGGAAVPTTTDTVFFDANSGANTVTIASGYNPTISTLTMTGFTGTLAFGSQFISCGGNATTVFTGASTYSVTGTPLIKFTYSGSTGTRTITPNTGITEANSISISVTAGSDAVSIASSNVIKNLDFTGYTGQLGTPSLNRVIYGNLTLGTGMTFASTATGGFTFSSTTAQQNITSNGVTIYGTITCNGTQTVQLQDALSLSTATSLTFTLTSGTLDLNNKTLTCGVVSSTNSNTRAILFGTGNITLTSSATTIWNFVTATNFTYTGTPTVNATYSGATGTRIIANGTTAGSETNAVSFNVSAGTDIVSLGAGGKYKNLNFTGFAGTLSNNTTNIYGNLTLSSGMTLTGGSFGFLLASTLQQQNITTNGNSTIDFPITFSGTQTYQLQDALTIGATRTVTLTTGTLDLNGKTFTCGLFSSANSNTRVIAFGTGNITVTGSGATVWNTATATNFTYTGTSTVNFTYSGSTGTRTIAQAGAANGGTEANALNMNFSAGSDTITFGGASRLYKNLDFTGFAGTYTNSQIVLVGNLKFPSSGITVGAGANSVNFAGTTQQQNITTGGNTLDFPIAFSGTNTYQFQDVLTQGSTRGFSFLTGTLQLKTGVTNTVGAFATSGTTLKYLISTVPGTQATISQDRKSVV